MGLPPEVPAWRQEHNACKNCERLEAELEAVRVDAADFEAKLSEAEAEIADLKETIRVRDSECKSEHYEALNGCISKLSEAKLEIAKLKSHNIAMSEQCKNSINEVFEADKRERVLVESLTEMVQAFVDYEMEVDIEPHHEHIKMMRKARAALAQKGDG